MDFLAILEQYGIPICVAVAFGFFIWKQNQFIQKELMEELDERFKRLEAILIKLIDQQKKMQIEQKGIEKSYKGLVDIISKLMNKNSSNGFKSKLEKFLKDNQ